jgi:hypothetical protein
MRSESLILVVAIVVGMSFDATTGLGQRVEPRDEVVVRDPQELRSVVRTLRAGMTLKIAPGEYPGGLHVEGIEGLTIEGLDPDDPPTFVGGDNAWQFSRCAKLTLRDLRLRGQTGNGLNLDDGGRADDPVTGTRLERIEIREVGPQGNHDGIKCSGLDRLSITDCTLVGWGGQGIDLVGCHDVLIRGCRFVGKPGFSASAGVQAKGGSARVTVEKCRFENAGERPLNVGGSTGLEYFRPRGVPYEAQSVVVRGCLIEGGSCAAAFVGVDGAEFSDNTVLYPQRWIFRLLQETLAEGFIPARNVVIKGNRIVFRRSQLREDVNIGGGTEPESMRFESNSWFAEDRPQASRPRLPVEEQNGSYGTDPRKLSK